MYTLVHIILSEFILVDQFQLMERKGLKKTGVTADIKRNKKDWHN